jgi:hypothetical protein
VGDVTACGLCGCPELAPILDMGMQPLAERYGTDERYPLVLLECGNCTLVQLSYIADPREVFPPGHTYATGNTKALREHYSSLAARLSASLTRPDLVVDIGCNDGTLLSYFPAGLVRVGFEPTRQAEKAEARGLEVWQEFFTAAAARRLRAELGAAQLVTACNVLAHVPGPHDAVAGIAHLLADDGVLVTENHDVHSVLDGLQIDTVYAEHNFYWSVTTLSRLLGDHGLVVTDVEKTGTHGGSFRVTARRQRTKDLQWRALEAAATLREKVSLAATEGPVYGIGATTRATPLIHYAGIAPYLSCVCEVPGSEKIGLTMPGTAIPVVDEAKLIADQPALAVLFSWHLADSIVPALRSKGYKGRILIPLPEPRVLHA